MEEKDFAMEAIVERMEEMKLEIAALKEALAARDAEAEECADGHHHDFSRIKSMFEESFEKLAETLRPILDKATRRVSEPTMAAVAKAEEKISLNPLAAVAIALGAGFIIGKVCALATHCYHCHCDDDEDEE